MASKRSRSALCPTNPNAQKRPVPDNSLPSPLPKKPCRQFTPFPTRFNLPTVLVELVTCLHAEQPCHPMFGPPQAGEIRLPLAASRANGQCWQNAMIKIGGWVCSEMGEKVTANTCWMSRSTQLQITQPFGPHRSTVLRSITVVRLLAFLKAPTEENWTKLNEGRHAIAHPFSHTCGRGLRVEGQQAACINGLHHGRFANRNENESHKLCTNGARCLCPGHGSPPVKCIFTHDDGTLKPCRNRDDTVPPCTCERRCF